MMIKCQTSRRKISLSCLVVVSDCLRGGGGGGGEDYRIKVTMTLLEKYNKTPKGDQSGRGSVFI